MRTQKLLSVLIAAICCACPASTGASAQRYPNRPISLVVPFPPGGLSDVPARIIAPELQQLLGVPVVVETNPADQE
jgi:tripartite-type tricarboxylate transporter receptor subunit TctC